MMAMQVAEMEQQKDNKIVAHTPVEKPAVNRGFAAQQ